MRRAADAAGSSPSTRTRTWARDSLLEPATPADLCRRHRIRKLSPFGSQLKGTTGPESDIDLLLEFEAGAAVTLFDMARIELELSALLGGRKADLRTAGGLSRHFREEVVRSAEPQYVAG